MLRDKRVQFAVFMGIAEWVIVGGLFLLMDDVNPFLIGAVLGISTWLQIAALFFPRRRNRAFTEAQQAFMAGDYERAALKLETLLASPDGVDIEQTQTLLGNTYRQLGRLVESEAVLWSALESHPKSAFALYGLGRTLLAQGRFAEAAEHIRSALANDGRKTTRADLALAYYLAGETGKAGEEAASAARQLGLEPYRVLMVNYILWKTREDHLAPAMMARTREGLRYWQAEADRFADTDYGKRLQVEIEAMEALLGKEA
jgi:tetratricopeptide (TPR) repeat protein